jgi:hypothetical protein
MMSLLFIVITILVLIINSNAFHTSITSNRLVNNKKLIDKKFIIDNSIVSTSSTSTSLSYRSNTKLNAVLKSQITKLIDRKDLTPEETEDAWDKILAGCDPAAVGALLTLLRAKGNNNNRFINIQDRKSVV